MSPRGRHHGTAQQPSQCNLRRIGCHTVSSVERQRCATTTWVHKKTAAAAAAMTPNFASRNACDVGTAAPVELAVVALAAMTMRTMLN
jgi:hypothetical protein